MCRTVTRILCNDLHTIIQMTQFKITHVHVTTTSTHGKLLHIQHNTTHTAALMILWNVCSVNVWTTNYFGNCKVLWNGGRHLLVFFHSIKHYINYLQHTNILHAKTYLYISTISEVTNSYTSHYSTAIVYTEIIHISSSCWQL